MIKKVYWMIWCALCTLGATAQTPTNLLQCIRDASQNDFQAKLLTNAADLTAYQLKMTQSQKLPTVFFDALYNYTTLVPTIEIGANELRFQPYHNANAYIAAQYTAWDFGKNDVQQEKDKAETVVALHQLNVRKHQLAYYITRLYFNALYWENAAKVQETQINLLRESEQLVNNRLKNGDEIEYSLIATQVRRQNIEITKAESLRQYQKQIIALEQFTNVKIANLDTTAARNIAQTVNFNLENNIELKTEVLKIEAAKKEIDIANIANYPTVNLTATTGIKNGTQPDIEAFRFNLTIGVKFSVPIFNGYRTQYKQEIAQIKTEMATNQYEFLTDNYKTALEQSLNDLEATKQKLDLAKSQIKQAKYALKLAQDRYESGVTTQLDILSAQSALQDALYFNLQLEYQYTMSQIAILELVGANFWE